MPEHAAIAVLLSAVDFEWSLRRTILALGTSPTKHIRESVLRRVSGPDAYKLAWNEEVYSNIRVPIHEAIPNWSALVNKKNGAYRLRNQLAHGIIGSMSVPYATEKSDSFLRASVDLNKLVGSHGLSIYRKIVRIKQKSF